MNTEAGIFDPLPQYKTLSIMPTWQCTAECANCGTLSSPRETTRLPLEQILSAIEQAATDNSFKAVVFTGGEATLAGKNLIVAIEKATSLGLPTRIVTNAHWASSQDLADSRVAELVLAGLKEINYSTGDQHTKFVPIENIIRASRAALKHKLAPFIMIETLNERSITKATLEEHPDFVKLRYDYAEASINISESPWMPLSPFTQFEYPENMAVNKSNLASRSGCESILSTTTIQANGMIGVCCGLGMRLVPELQSGSIYDTTIADAEEKARNDFLKLWIKVEGPEKILAWAATHDPSIEWENMYSHRCQACLRLYQDPKVGEIIREHHQEKIADVLLGEWLLYKYQKNEIEEDCYP
jgi:organic radical activating enzyme